ncbi:MAG: RNA polymerase subunit sigma [Phycisphaerales bacterium]|nr:RNA polymerase subunit sigma [Phycisphaerales bacterium]
MLRAATLGDRLASEQLLPLVYDELRLLARGQIGREAPGQTLQPTALVHEAYLRLLGPGGGAELRWDSRGHFFAAAALAMRRILVERARARGRIKRGGGRGRVDLADEPAAGIAEEPEDMLALDEALTALESHNPRVYRVVMLRYFAGLGLDDTAAALGIGATTVKAEWNYARAWLHRAIGGGPGGPP